MKFIGTRLPFIVYLLLYNLWYDVTLCSNRSTCTFVVASIKIQQ